MTQETLVPRVVLDRLVLVVLRALQVFQAEQEFQDQLVLMDLLDQPEAREL